MRSSNDLRGFSNPPSGRHHVLVGVNPRVGNVKNNDPSLIEPVAMQ
jgi:hypothetical protein